MSDKSPPRTDSGFSRTSGSISASFLGLKAQLERSKASLFSSTLSSSKRKTSSSSPSTEYDSQKKHSSSSYSLHTEDSNKSKGKTSAIAALAAARDGGKNKGKGKGKGKNRATSDWASTPCAQLETIRQNLERKARIYDQLQAGKYAGVSSKALEEGSIDWERKLAEQPQYERETSPDASVHSDKVDEADPEIEYVDEFGRTRTARLSNVPRDLLPSQYGGDYQEASGQEEADNAIYGPANSFPVYHPAAHPPSSAATGSSETHFNPDFETRHRGAAFYRFATSGPQRQRQMQQLAQLRQQTIDNRNSTAQIPNDKTALKHRLATRANLVHEQRLTVLGKDKVEQRRKHIESQRLQALLPQAAHKTAQ